MNPPTLPQKTFTDNLRETHTQAMTMGPTGPLVMFCVFVSSLSMNLVKGLCYVCEKCPSVLHRR